MTGDAEALNFYGQIHTMKGLKYRDLAIDGCLFTGEPNFHEALKWYIQAAKAGHVGSLYNAGQIYEGGLTGEKNFSKAVNLYKEVISSKLLYS
jgi:TPR repeat protein